MQFSAKNLQNNKIIQIWELAHPPRENPGSATVMHTMDMISEAPGLMKGRDYSPFYQRVTRKNIITLFYRPTWYLYFQRCPLPSPMKTGWRKGGNVERRQCGFPSRVPFLALLPSLLLSVTLSTITKTTIMNELIFTARKRSLGKRNVLYTCLSFCSQGGGGLLPPLVVRPPFRCRPSECRSPWMQNPPGCRTPWMQIPQMQTPLEAHPQMQTTL